MFDLDLFEKEVNRVYFKKLAVEICTSFLARTISQSEFRVRNGKDFERDELYYRLNVRPNKNQTASTFWGKFVSKMVRDNEVLVIQADDSDLLIADSFSKKEYAVYEDIFNDIVVRDFEFERSYKQSEVIHLKYSNERLSPLIDSLFDDYGELYGRFISFQKRKGQVRGTVDLDTNQALDEKSRERLQSFIDNMYKAIRENDVAIVPQQKGFQYDEKAGGSSSGQSVDEINKVTNGFLDQVAMAMGIPVSLIRGDMADVEKQTKNYMFFTVSPLLKKIKDEANVKFFTKEEHLKGKHIEIRKPSYRDIFDLATAVDKLISSGVFNGNELRSELGKEMTDEEIHKRYFVTKNYQREDEALQVSLEGGEDEK